MELTLSLIDAFNRRDVDRAVAFFDEEGAWYPAMEAAAEGNRTYRAELRQYYRDLAEFSKESQLESSEVYDRGGLVTWRNGKCLEARTWLNSAEALEAAGLRE